MEILLRGIDSQESKEALYSTIHGAGRVMSRTKATGKKRWRKGQLHRVTKGEISTEMMLNWVKEKGVELRGAGTDESPHCYKRLDDVLKWHDKTIEVLHTLKPIGVAMAGENEFDPYRD